MLIHVSLHPVALKGVVPINFQRLLDHMGYDGQKGTNALIARSRSKRQPHDPPFARWVNSADCQNRTNALQQYQPTRSPRPRAKEVIGDADPKRVFAAFTRGPHRLT